MENLQSVLTALIEEYAAEIAVAVIPIAVLVVVAVGAWL